MKNISKFTDTHKYKIKEKENRVEIQVIQVKKLLRATLLNALKTHILSSTTEKTAIMQLKSLERS